MKYFLERFQLTQLILLISKKGIGPKVADCVCLFGLSHRDAFPVDTHIKQLLSKLDDPQDKLKAVHIAGTNGKGSILAYISNSVLSGKGGNS